MKWLLIPRQEPGKLYVAGRGGVFETQDSGISWIFHHFDSNLALVDNISISPFNEGPVYVSVNGAIYSNKKGQWVRGRGLLAFDVRDIVTDPKEPFTAYAGVYLPNKWSVFTTVDGGENWQSTSPPSNIPEKYFNDTIALDIAPTEDGTILYAGTNGCGVIYSIVRGFTWETNSRQSCLLPENAPVNILDIAIDPHSSSRLYVAADGTKFFITEDKGQSWQSYIMPVTTEIVAIAVDPKIKGRIYFIAGAEGFWRSDDSGKTWKSFSEDLEKRVLTAMSITPDTSQTLFVGAKNGEVWYTTDGGEHWTPIRENLAIANIQTMASKGIDMGVWLGSERKSGLYRYQPGPLSKFFH